MRVLVRRVGAPGAGWGGAWAALGLLLLTRALPFESRSLSAIVDSGPSPQNYVEVVSTAVAAGWILWALNWRTVQPRLLFRRHWRWFLLLCAVYALSAAWSPLPALTAYRAAELLAAATIVLFLFGMSNDPYGDLLRVLYLCTLVCAADAFVVDYRLGTWPDHLLGALRSNPGGGVASSLLVFALFAKGFRPRMRAFHSAAAIIALVVFGSLASYVALLTGVLAGCAMAARNRLVGATVLFLFLSIAVVALLDVSVPDLTEQVGALLDRPAESIRTGTGRFGLWEETLKVTANRPFGGGYVAAERLLSLRADVSKSLVWQARNSHNGFLSAWEGAGYIGLLVLCAYLLALWRTLSLVGGPNSPALRPMLVVLIITNFSVSSLGGRLDMVSVVAFALAALLTAGACAGSWAAARSMSCRR